MEVGSIANCCALASQYLIPLTDADIRNTVESDEEAFLKDNADKNIVRKGKILILVTSISPCSTMLYTLSRTVIMN